LIEPTRKEVPPMLRRSLLPALAGLSTTLLAVPPASADAIDGDWCSNVGMRRLTIEGPGIVTPAGKQWTGLYSRHSFEYLAPPGEKEAGKHVAMRLVNEYVMLFRPDGATDAEVWNRCAKPTV
jgi:hypothetical protein